MTDELTILENDNTNQEISQVIYKKPVSLTFARITVCTGLITGLLFLRVGNNKVFKDVSCCYKKSVCYESENASKIQETISGKIETIINDFKSQSMNNSGTSL